MATLIPTENHKVITRKLTRTEIKATNIMALEHLEYELNWEATKMIMIPYLMIDESYQRFKIYKAKYPGKHMEKQVVKRIHVVFHEYFQRIFRVMTEQMRYDILTWMDEFSEYMENDFSLLEEEIRKLYINEKKEEHLEELTSLSMIISCINIAAGFVESFGYYVADKEMGQLQKLIMKLELAMIGKNIGEDDPENKNENKKDFNRVSKEALHHFNEFFHVGKFERNKEE